MAEKRPIIRLVLAKQKEAWHQLSEEEQQEFMGKDIENLKELDGKVKMMVDCRWSNEEWHFVGIEEWPTIEALQKRATFEKEVLKGNRYAELKTYLGNLLSDEYTQA